MSSAGPIHVAEEACDRCSVLVYSYERAVCKAADLEPLVHPWHYCITHATTFPQGNWWGTAFEARLLNFDWSLPTAQL